MGLTTRRILQVGTGALLGLVVALLLVPLLERGDDAPDDPHMLPAPYPAPSATLTDHRGRAAALPGDFDGLTVVFFGYTHCPDVCPLTMAALAAARDRLSPEAAERFRAVLVTVDPERDTPERLGEYLAGFDETFVGLTGTEADIREVARAWGAWGERAVEPPTSVGRGGHPVAGDTAARDTGEGGTHTPGDAGAAGADTTAEGGEAHDPHDPHDPHAAHGGPGGSPAARGYLVDHTARAFVVDRRGRIVATFPASTPAGAMLPTVRRLLGDPR